MTIGDLLPSGLVYWVSPIVFGRSLWSLNLRAVSSLGLPGQIRQEG